MSKVLLSPRMRAMLNDYDARRQLGDAMNKSRRDGWASGVVVFQGKRYRVQMGEQPLHPPTPSDSERGGV